MPVLFRFIPLFAAMASAMAQGATPVPTSTVWKCAGEAGAVVYQDVPCPAGKELRNLATDPPSLSVVPGTPVPASRTQSPVARSERASAKQGPPSHKSASVNAADRKFIQIGMSASEVLQRIGKPDIDARNSRGHGQRWSYLPKEGDPNTITTVTLVDGKVADVERKIVR